MKFASEYKKLNEKQKKAVDTIEGPVMVVAGPGTGKTQILTLRIANILAQTDTEPENILAITFTESGASSMRKRLLDLIGSTAYSVNITTFHSFANSIIQEYGQEFAHIIGSVSISEVEQVELLRKVVKSEKLDLLRPFGDPEYYVKSILRAINDLKRENVSYKKFESLLAQEEADLGDIEDLRHVKGVHKGKVKGKYQRLLKNLEKNKELALVYEKYQRVLRRKKLYDYSDMIMEVVNVLEKNEELLYWIQEKYQYVLVDEHQDTNNAQNKLLELMMNFHKSPNLFVVGDEKQAIFRFQGASLENFLYFKHLYPRAKLITLESNYRSHQVILDGAYSINPGVEKIKLKAKKNTAKSQIGVAGLSSAENESYFVARHIKERLRSGASPKEIAVLYRDNKDSFAIARMMEKLGVPFVIESDENIFEDEEIKKILLVLETIKDFGSSEMLARFLHIGFLGIDPLDIYKLVRYSKRDGGGSTKNNLYGVLRSKGLMRSLGINDIDKLHDLYRKLVRWKKGSEFKNIAVLFEEVIRDSGFLDYILSLDGAHEKLEKLNSLFDEVKTMLERHKNYDLNRFVEYIFLLRDHNLLVKNVRLSIHSKDRVRLMTAHKSKGREFDYVYITASVDGHWGNRRVVEKLSLPPRVARLITTDLASKDSDARNLFYVALTRAKKEVLITWARESADKKECLPSQFIEELDEKLRIDIDTSQYEVDFEEAKEVVFRPEEKLGSKKMSARENEFISELFSERGLSVTGLNNYLKCPWRWFYNNLLRIPEAKNKYMIFGTLIHKVLEDAIGVGKKPTKAKMVKFFNELLEKESLSKRDYAELKKKGEVAIVGYYDKYSADWTNMDCISELNISGVVLNFAKQSIRLNGKLDRVDILSAGDVRVVDYKTGKPKSRNVLLGETKNSDGDYFRQLVFYKLLLSRFKDGKYNMVEGEIDFVEPNDRGVFKREVFEVTDSQVEELENLIKEVVEEIFELGFWSRRCKDKKCEYCKLRNLMK